MTKCPKCGAEIEVLHLYAKQGRLWRVWLDGDDLLYDWIDDISDFEDTEYVCPECGETLFLSDEGAKEFLKSGVVKMGKAKLSQCIVCAYAPKGVYACAECDRFKYCQIWKELKDREVELLHGED